MAGQTRVIKVISQVSGEKSIKDIANSLDRMNRSIKATSDSALSLKNMVTAVFGAQIFGFGIRELTSMADTMTQLSSKLNIFVGEGDRAKRAFSELTKIADDTRAPLTSIATIFTRLATSTERLGLSTELQLAVTRSLQQSFRVSGATAEEATASTIQFAQALSFGQLRGQELRSVLSQNSALATIFSKAIEGSGKDIYKFAEAGGFTTKFVLKALIENMSELEAKASKLAPTFEQSLNRAMNKFTESVARLNEQFGISAGFAKFIDYILTNGDAVMGILLSLAVTAIPRLVQSIKALNLVSLMNPIGLLAAAVGGLTYAAIEAAGGFRRFMAEMQTLPAVLSLVAIKTAELVTKIIFPITLLLSETDNPVSRGLNKIKQDLSNFIIETRMAAQYSEKVTTIWDELALMKSGTNLADELNGLKDPAKSLEEQIGALNVAFSKGLISAERYASGISKLEKAKLNEKLEKGSISLSKYNEELSKLRFDDITRQLDIGSISIDQFNQAINQFKIEELNRKFYEGKLTVRDYNSELMKLKIEGMNPDDFSTGFIKGLNSFIEGVGTTSDQIASLTKSVFSSMEDAIFQATKGSTRSFAEMTQAILDDITKIAIRMAIVKPLAEGLLGGLFGNNTTATGGSGGIGSSPNATAGNQFAMGGAFENGIQKFATGGVVSSPTYFGLSSGKMGLMGEAGPEAIVPLKRSSDGSLGVGAAPTVVNVHNYTQSEVQTRETVSANGTKTIDVVIISKVKEAIAGGAFDRTFQQNFGLNRRGV
ncbi:phage tail tape measure protein [Candidatus Dependentiae bacterium]|nr:MAG: phage tail tape measure protein [Candidatus Dependentiae bacterium]